MPRGGGHECMVVVVMLLHFSNDAREDREPGPGLPLQPLLP